MVVAMARGKQVTSYVPSERVEAFDKMVGESGLTPYLFIAKLIDDALVAGGYWKRVEKKGLDTSMLSAGLPVKVKRRRRHARRPQ